MAFICLSEAGSAQQTKFVSIVIFNTEGMYKILLNSVWWLRIHTRLDILSFFAKKLGSKVWSTYVKLFPCIILNVVF